MSKKLDPPKKAKTEKRKPGGQKRDLSQKQIITAMIEIGLGTSIRLIAEELKFTEAGFRKRFKEELPIAREYFKRYAYNCLAKRLPKSDRLIELVMKTQFGWRDQDVGTLDSPIVIETVEEGPTPERVRSKGTNGGA